MKEILVAYNKNNKNCKGLPDKLLYVWKICGYIVETLPFYNNPYRWPVLKGSFWIINTDIVCYIAVFT